MFELRRCGGTVEWIAHPDLTLSGRLSFALDVRTKNGMFTGADSKLRSEHVRRGQKGNPAGDRACLVHRHCGVFKTFD